jgi:hypothetical protein
MRSSRCLLALLVAFAAASVLANDASAQSGPGARRTETGPEIGAPDEALRRSRQSQRPRKMPPRNPSPPDGPDEDPDGGRSSAQCETAVAIDPNDEKHAVAVAVDLEAGWAVTRWYTTFDGGATWTTGAFKNEPGYILNGDCAVVITPGGVPVIAAMHYYGAGGNAVYSYRSLDGGLSWQSGVLVDLDPTNDKVQAAVDLSSGPRRGQVAIAWDRFFTSTGDLIYAAVSDDEGASFVHVQRVDDTNFVSNISPDVAYGPNSELWIMWADRGLKDIWVDKSTDGGATWGTDVKAGDFVQVPFTIPGSFFRIFDIFSIAVDWTDGPYSGNVYILYHRWQKAAPQNASVYCLRSEDGGATWRKTNVNASDTTDADQLMPFAQVDEHGNVNVAYFDRRLDPNNYLLWTWVARSSDGGRTWDEFPASDAGWDHNFSDSPYYIGDYIGLDVSSHAVRPFFPDGRTGSIDVMSDEMHLDLHTSPSELSAATGGVVDFTLNVGPNHDGQNYWLLGSLSTDPGLDIGPVYLPLNFDVFFQLTMSLANSPTLQNSLGVLDSNGSATIRLDSGGPFDPSIAGIDLHFAAFVWADDPVYGTNATKVSLVP